MKNIKSVLIFCFLLFSAVSFGQLTAPGDESDGLDGSATPVGGGAPVGSGVLALAVMASGYGLAKTKFLGQEERSL